MLQTGFLCKSTGEKKGLGKGGLEVWVGGRSDIWKRRGKKGMYEGTEEGTALLKAAREPNNLCTLYG